MSNHIGRETFVEVEGKKYKLSRFTRKLLAQFLDWADSKLPDPLDLIRDKLHGFPLALQEIMVRDAIQSARLRKSINSPDVQSLMGTTEGMMKIIALLFQQHHPELTDLDVERIFDQCQLEHGENYLVEKIADATGRYTPEDKGGEGTFPANPA